MSWTQIQPSARRASGAVRLSITRRQRRGRTEVWARLRFDAAVLQQLALAPGDHVALFCGQNEDRGKIALRATERGPDSFRLAPYGGGACLTVAADLLGSDAALVVGSYVLSYEVVEGLLVLPLPPQLHAMPDPILPCTQADAPAAGPAALRTVAAVTVRMTQDLSGHEPSAEGDGSAPVAQRPRRQEAWTAADDQELRRMRQAGLSAATIAAALGRSPAAVALRASKLRMPKQTGRKVHKSGPIVPAEPVPPAASAESPAIAEALAWLRWEGEAAERLEDGGFCIGGERVTPLRLVQIANHRRARRSPPLPALLLPAPDMVHSGPAWLQPGSAQP